MAKRSPQFVCQACGNVTPRWAGRCEACGTWNSIVEEDAPAPVTAAGKTIGRGRVLELVPLSGEDEDAPRTPTGIAELDRVTGGGFVRGSAVLIGGDPGIGKSTLLIQAAARLADRGGKVVYISGEEAIGQVRLRASRVGLAQAKVGLGAETRIEDILATLQDSPPDLVVIDSIQTMWTDAADPSPGTVTQIRAVAQALIRFAKKSGTTVVLVGHVTKEGTIAGPRVVEHMVDAVLYFEGDSAHRFRILRSVKNRFGPTDEIGVFEMTGGGLEEVGNPSQLFLGERDAATPGAAVFAGMEGSRPLLVEIQALVAPSPLGTPRRAVVGWDSSRLSMVLAVLDAHCGLKLGGHDIYLNIAGGLRIAEPAADLAAAAALVSSLAQAPLPQGRVFFGEISLSGGVRPVPHAPARLREALKLGFEAAVAPKGNSEDGEKGDLPIESVETLAELVARIAAGSEALRQ
ncbi:DNA repair protein RadA [Lutibaculum baratangense]|uniref:DNA repair protein RadA n=1 Tax=Lutibaculum baratangense AMV1 TaxID=631454 RepID=V4QV35_9HYPH|nr:DNA repair protein RadA [Lutibaculum baratangense]ESR23617.1 DNA repair protein RadA [Lutibaculum baratangense AMV1]